MGLKLIGGAWPWSDLSGLSDFEAGGRMNSEHMTDDGTLLRSYLFDHSQAAFGEIVRRHLDLVYSGALRALRGDSHRAQEVTQRVFFDLARKAEGLCQRTTLAGWLHISAHLAATEMMRNDARREHRERQAHLMHEIEHKSGPSPDWTALEPVLDSVVRELGAAERDLILLRYFEQRSFVEIGSVLGISEDTAQKRASRALDKMRTRLARRGITSSSSALTVLLSTQAAVAAPAGLATVASAVAASAGGVGVPWVTLLLMNMKTASLGIGAAVAIAGLLGTAWQYRANLQLRADLVHTRSLDAEVLATSQAAAVEARVRLQQQVDALRAELAAINEKVPRSSRSGVVAGTVNAPFPPSKSNPRSAAKTVRASIDGGDPATLRQTMVIASEGREMADAAFHRLSADMQEHYGDADSLIAELLCATTPSSPEAVQILDEELNGARGLGHELDDDPQYRTLHTKTQEPSGRVRDSVQVFQRTDDGWRWVVSKGLVMKRLVETGLMRAPVPAP
jgi:RNA polymerase sigma factor (sigma-70 family)